jgi:hypothetical protein
MPEGIMFEQITKGEYPKFFLKQITPLGANSF